LFEPIARRHFGPTSWLGAALFGAATATNLFTGRLAFAFGALPAMGAVFALDRDRPWIASSLALLAALSSPVAALFVALAAAAHALGTFARTRRPRPAFAGTAVALAALVPVAVVAVAFPEGGAEPFAFSALWPVPLLAAGVLLALPRRDAILRAGVIVYALVTIASYAVASPLGSNAARLATLLGAPVAALLLWPRKRWLLAVVALPLLYLEWQAPVRDLVIASGEPSASTSYYRPLLRFLERQSAAPFRVEIPFTRLHWEAYAVASRFPSPRGWERQLDIKDNAIFYSGPLTAATYEAWLHRNAVRYVAAPDAPLDYSAVREMRLISAGLPYLRLVERTAHWKVYAVTDATPIAQGAATLRGMGPDWLTLEAARAGTTVLRIRFSPYWALSQGSGCVTPAGENTAVTLRRPGPARLKISFAPDRIGAHSARCTKRDIARRSSLDGNTTRRR
jgi:MFS family permease